MKKIGWLVGLLGLLTSCADLYDSNGEQQYMSSRNGTVVKVNPPLSSANISDFYDLPEQDKDAKVSTMPPH